MFKERESIVPTLDVRDEVDTGTGIKSVEKTAVVTLFGVNRLNDQWFHSTEDN